MLKRPLDNLRRNLLSPHFKPNVLVHSSAVVGYLVFLVSLPVPGIEQPLCHREFVIVEDRNPARLAVIDDPFVDARVESDHDEQEELDRVDEA